MKNVFQNTTPRLLLLAFGLFVIAGCHSDQVSDKPGADMNNAMSAEQKAAISQHKAKAEQ